MITLSYRILGERKFQTAFGKLDSFTGFDPKVAYRVSRITDAVQKQFKKSSELYTEVVKKHACLDKNGNIEVDQFNNIKFPTKEGEAAFNAEVSALPILQAIFEIKAHKLRLEELTGVGLAPFEISVLEDIIESPDKHLKLIDGGREETHGKKDQEA